MTTLRTRLTGLVFLGVIAGLVLLTVALYDKAFTRTVDVTLEADHIGNQLSTPADVKIRGLVVGTVREVASDGSGARITMALQPDKVDLIPSNVKAQLLPKTLFGEKFVNLVEPAAPAPTHLRDGDVIPQDRTETARETEKVLSDLLPLLQTLEPQQLSLTLNAVSGALRGRGNQVGGNLVALDTYLQQLNPEVPGIQENVRRLASLSETFDEAAPDFLGLLDNFSAVSRNLVDQQQELGTFLRSTTTSVDRIDDVVSENEDRLVQLASSSRPSLELLARYAPEFPCIAKGLSAYEPTVSSTFGGRQPGLHITLELTQDNGAYVKGDEPRQRDDRAPYCDGLPNPKVPAPDTEFKDGYRDAERAGTGSSSAAASGPTTDPALYLGGEASLGEPAVQQALLKAVAAPVLGMPVDDVPDLVDLLFGPVARGNQVGLS